MASASEAGPDSAGQQDATAGSGRGDWAVMREGGGAQLTDLQARMRSHEQPGESVRFTVAPIDIVTCRHEGVPEELGGHASQWDWCLADVAANTHVQP